MASVMQVYVQDANHSTLQVSVFGHLPLIGPDARRFVRWLGKAVPYRASVRIQSTWPHRLAPALEPTLMLPRVGLLQQTHTLHWLMSRGCVLCTSSLASILHA